LSFLPRRPGPVFQRAQRSMSSLRARPKADPKASLAAEKAAARATRRQELARIIAEKQEQLARVKANNSGPASDERCHHPKDYLRQDRIAPSVSSGTSADGDRSSSSSTSSKPIRNKENQVPIVGSLQAAYQARRHVSKTDPGRTATRDVSQKAGAGVTSSQLDQIQQQVRSMGNGSKDGRSKDKHAIEDQYSFDLAKVEEMLKKETSEDMEEMYSFDLSKLDKVENSSEQKLTGCSTAEAHFEELSMRARRKSAPMPREVRDDAGHKEEDSKRENWQEVGMRQLAAENRALKERAERLESEYKRLQSLARTLPAYDVDSLEFAEMD